MKLLTIYCCLSLILIKFTCGFKHLQDSIPNGDKVNHPCKPNFIWWGVGHKNAAGGGSRNPFGADFERLGKDWTKICRLDSDGDKRTNGEELNDPNCQWRPGQAAPGNRATVTHPGICEPINSTDCQIRNKDWDICKEVEFKCNATNEVTVQSLELSLIETTLPPKETLYYCQSFDLPNNELYHVIATKPEIKNREVCHHMILYGCPDKPYPNSIADKYKTPQPCGMDVATNCPEALGGWSLGEVGNCLPDEFGYKFGKGMMRKVVLQMHWNNPLKLSTHKDSSGMRLYYTSKLRPNDGSIFTLGQQYLAIPPAKPRHIETADCPAKCTKDIKQSLTLSRGSLHMHYLGSGGTVTITKKSTGKTVTLLNQPDYRYDSPKSFDMNNMKLEAGDALNMSCEFKSVGQTRTTYWGEGTFAEMCYAFISYYPVNEFSTCVQYRKWHLCDAEEDQIATCNFTAYLASKKTDAAFTKVYTDCQTDTCTEACKQVTDGFKKEECWKGLNGLIMDGLLPMVLNDTGVALQKRIQSCIPLEWYQPAAKPTTISPTISGTPKAIVSVGFTFLLAFFNIIAK